MHITGRTVKLEDWIGKWRDSVWIEEKNVGRKKETWKCLLSGAGRGER